jgi:glycolate oxidase iron-sulfur subunit
MKAVLEGRAIVDDHFTRHIDSCLGCMGCVTACPSGVRYDRLIEATRPEVERHTKRSTTDRLFRDLLFSLLPYPRRLRWAARALRVAQTLGLPRALRRSGLAARLPARLAALERLAPQAPRRDETVAASTPAVAPRRRRVGLLLGCVQRIFFPGVNAATARVLAAEGCDVAAPPGQACCGALMLHAGRIDEARTAARRLIDAFTSEPVDQIVVNAAGCGSAMKDYGELLRDDAQYATRAREFSARCVDISEALADIGPRAARQPIRLTVAYHDACHLSHAQRIRRQPRDLLGAIPELAVREIPEADLCCGSAGVYNLLEPDAGLALRDRKARNVAGLGVDALVSSNPGCLLQIASGLEAAGRPIPTFHIVELLDASIRGVGPLQ